MSHAVTGEITSERNCCNITVIFCPNFPTNLYGKNTNIKETR